MPRRCIAASCSTSTAEGYSFTSFREMTARMQNEHGPLNAFKVTGMDLR